MHAHRVHATRRLKEAHRGFDLAKPQSNPCPDCGMRRGLACDLCGGNGRIVQEPDVPGDLPELLADEVGLFVRAWGTIEKYGVRGWIALQPPGFEPHELLGEALAVFNGELSRLEQDQDVRDAIEQKRDERE